jgi:hypothetical protein
LKSFLKGAALLVDSGCQAFREFETMSFLENHEIRPLTLRDPNGLSPAGLVLGKGANALEVVITTSLEKPTTPTVRSAWKTRVAGRATPVLLVVLYGDRAGICGPLGEQSPVYLDIEPGKIERTCSAALQEPSRHHAILFLKDAIPALESQTSGLRNEGLFATHELINGVPKRDDWDASSSKAAPLLSLRDRSLLQALGYTLEQLPGREYILRTAQSRIALALLLEREESPDAGPIFSGSSPVSQALAKADAENLEYVIVTSGSRIRLYPVRPGVGTGQRGRTETFTELHLDLLAESQAGYLWLMFSASALQKQGSVSQILESSTRYAVDLGARLRDRVYSDVIPPLAQALIHARAIDRPTAAQLRETYQMALTVLFRLLFIAYAEDKGLLPFKTNDLYRTRSLKQQATELTQHRKEGQAFSVGTTTHWEEVERLFRAVDRGHAEWGVPAYNGGLFSSDPVVSPVGAAIAEIKLPDQVFGDILAALIVDRTSDGWGPVDFRSLGVREFGTIYEGLLENELAIADTNLTTEIKDKEEKYRPAKPRDEVKVAKGQAFLHNTSGARKSTGSYFTKDFAVEHLLDKGLEPALLDHLARLDGLSDREAGEAFFDFRVADITMGSGHFLVSALDRIERAFSGYLAKRQLPDVTDELNRLRKAAADAMLATGSAIEIENTQLLRRQIARRCIYGVDINPIAVELARLALWIHTFVPGLPLSFLDHGLVVGNSLVGIATLEEATEEIRELLRLPLFDANAEELLEPAREALARLGRLSDADASEVIAARRAASEARDLTRPAAALFDVLTAARISEEVKSALLKDPAFERGGHLDQLVGSRAHKLATKALTELPPFHFPVALPEVFLRARPGFDVILGNPPWEEVMTEEHRFWIRHQPGFHSLRQGEQQEVRERLYRERPDLVAELQRETNQATLLRKVLVASGFHGMSTGNPDVYKAAVWRFLHLAREEYGRVSVVLPRIAFAGRGTAEFRKTLLAEAQLTDVTQLVNKQNWVFSEVHPQYTFVLVSWIHRSPRIADDPITVFGPFSSLARFRRGVEQEPVQFTVAQLLSWSETASFPLLPSPEAAGVFLQLRRSPRLELDDPKSWQAIPYQEFNATTDKPLMTFENQRPKASWPVFKGESFDLWEPDTGRYYGWANAKRTCDVLNRKRTNSARLARSGFFGLSDEILEDPETLPCMSPRIAFRDISRSTDTRTVRVALIPPKVFLTNKAPYFLWPRGDERDVAYLLGVMSSLALDWYARRFVDISLNYHILNPFPIPRPARTSRLWDRTVALAGRLASPDDRFAEWAAAVGVNYGPLEEDDKEDKIHELDAIVAHLYGLSESQLRHIFETFHEGWNYTKRMDATLVHFRRWQTRL